MHIGWGTEPFGSLNCRRGEYDSAHYFCVTLGLPVWFSYRGCYHVAPITQRTPAATVGRLQDFAERYLVTTIGGLRLQLSEVLVPLRDSKPLKRMMLFYWFLWITGLAALMAVIATSAILPRGVVAKDVPWLIAFWTGFVLFVPSFAYYHYLRRARGRSAQIREIVAAKFGPFTDPAEWDPALAMRVLADFAPTDLSRDTATAAVTKLLENGSPADALVLARLSLGMHDPPAGSLQRRQIEDLTDRCLQTASNAVVLARLL